MIGDRIKEDRDRLNLTLPAFAEAAGAKKRTAIDWQNGTSSPTAAQLAALAKVGVDVRYVVTGERASETQKELDLRLRLVREATDKAISLELPVDRQGLVRDVLLGVALGNVDLLNSTIDGFLSTHGSASSTAQQSFQNSSVGEVAGRDIVNKGRR